MAALEHATLATQDDADLMLLQAHPRIMPDLELNSKHLNHNADRLHNARLEQC